MTRILQDEFMECQEDMVAIAKEYIDNRAEKIYLYGSIENGVYFFNLFFKINNKILSMSQVNTALNDYGKEIDISSNRREKVLDIGIEDLQKLEEVCIKYQKDVPTQIKLYYDIQKNSLKAKYKYDPIYTHVDELDTHNIFMSWYDEIKKEVEG